MMKVMTIANTVKRQMQIQRKKIDRTQILIHRLFFVSLLIDFKKLKRGRLQGGIKRE